MYQLLAGLVVVICFILGMNSRSISGVKEETKIPPDPGKEGVNNSAPLGVENMKSREQIKSELKLLAQTVPASKGDEISATCYRVSPDIKPPEFKPVTPESGTVEVPAKSPAAEIAFTSAVEARSSSKDKIRAELQKLAASTAPDRKSLIANADCYKPRMLKTAAEYVCEKCKTKTVFPTLEEPAANLIDGIAGVRRMVSHISSKNLNIRLDESKLCTKCSGGKQTGDISIVISYSGENEPVRSKVTLFDMELVTAFIDGKDRVPLDGPDAAPLKDYQKRLQEILGVEPEGR